VLSLAVDDPVWAAQLRWLEADLLARVAEVTGPGVVERISLRVRR
jgi:predicted nucleic acid-binding Zn ribbon protein